VRTRGALEGDFVGGEKKGSRLAGAERAQLCGSCLRRCGPWPRRRNPPNSKNGSWITATDPAKQPASQLPGKPGTLGKPGTFTTFSGIVGETGDVHHVFWYCWGNRGRSPRFLVLWWPMARVARVAITDLAHHATQRGLTFHDGEM
jgi:hypothetical protein